MVLDLVAFKARHYTQTTLTLKPAFPGSLGVHLKSSSRINLIHNVFRENLSKCVQGRLRF